METRVNADQHVRFRPFDFDLKTHELRKRGQDVAIRGHPAEVLAALLEHPGEVVTRAELRKKLWPDNTYVDFEHILNNSINKLREALGDEAAAPRYIETLPGLGYRFVGSLDPSVDRASRQEPEPAVGNLELDSGPKPVETDGTIALRQHSRKQLWWIAGASMIVLVLAGLTAGLIKMRTRPFPAALHRIAVLPLADISPEPIQDYFADGMTAQLISGLGQVRGLQVISRTSVMRYKGTQLSLPQIAHELSVDWLIEGTVQRAGNRVSITAELIDAKSDSHLWSGGFQRDMTDILSLEAEIARAIAGELDVKLTSEDKLRLHPNQKIHPEAYEAYLIGSRLADSFQNAKAATYFELATKKDPGFAPAYAALASVEESIAYWSERPLSDRGLNASTKALELDPQLSDAHDALAWKYMSFDWNWTAAEAEERRAVQLDPNSAAVAMGYADMLKEFGRWDAALAEARRALQLDPTSVQTNDELLDILIAAHRFDEAFEQFHRCITINSANSSATSNAWLHLTQVYVLQGRDKEALNAFLNWGRLAGGKATRYVALQPGAANGGLKAYMRQALREEEEKNSRSRPFYLATLYVLIGEKEEGVKMLELAYSRHSPRLVQLRTHSFLEPLHSDPRFQAILQKMHFPE